MVLDGIFAAGVGRADHLAHPRPPPERKTLIARHQWSRPGRLLLSW